jgi:hypothetical protein
MHLMSAARKLCLLPVYISTVLVESLIVYGNGLAAMNHESVPAVRTSAPAGSCIESIVDRMTA